MQREQQSRTEVVAAEPVVHQPIVQQPKAHVESEEHIHLAPQSIWPISTAAGTSLAGAGLVTILPVTILGVLLMIISIYYWIQELRHELH
jgi:hypothetical protein